MSTPFDLHVLSTPPAFILSQDQTLNKMVSKQRSKSLLKSLSLIAKSSFQEFKEKERCPTKQMLHGQLILSVWCFVFLLRCLIYKVHAVVCSKQVYCTLAQLFAFVKKIFFFFRQRFFCFSVTALIIYHRLPGLSSTFFIFLQMHGASHQLFFSNVAPHCRQVTLILPFPRGTRNLMPQEGQRKILYCLLCSILTRQL